MFTRLLIYPIRAASLISDLFSICCIRSFANDPIIRCFYNWNFHNIIIIYIYLHAFFPVSLAIQEFRSVSTTALDNVELVCVVRAQQTPEVQFFLPNSGLITKMSDQFSVRTSATGPYSFVYISTLAFLRVVTDRDSGVYTCRAIYNGSQAEATAILTGKQMLKKRLKFD